MKLLFREGKTKVGTVEQFLRPIKILTGYAGFRCYYQTFVSAKYTRLGIFSLSKLEITGLQVAFSIRFDLLSC